MEPDYEQILQELFNENPSSDWCSDGWVEILKRHFEQFKKDLVAQILKNMYLEEIPNLFINEHCIPPTCPGIADKATFKPAGRSVLEALHEGAKNPVVHGNEVCPVCSNQTEICSYCERNR